MLFVSVRDIDGALALLMLDEYFAQSKLVAQLGVPVLIIHVACTQVGPGGAGQGIPDAQLRTLEGLVWGHTGVCLTWSACMLDHACLQLAIVH